MVQTSYGTTQPSRVNNIQAMMRARYNTTRAETSPAERSIGEMMHDMYKMMHVILAEFSYGEMMHVVLQEFSRSEMT